MPLATTKMDRYVLATIALAYVLQYDPMASHKLRRCRNVI
jgi:hypothetical protein